MSTSENEQNMKPRICRSCGEPIAEGGNELSRNPNVCASCSSMADGMGEPDVSESGDGASNHSSPPRPEESAVTKGGGPSPV
jgi:hypothetical protein